MLAYERWGQDCPDHLLGDWSLALWDQRRRQLFLARDHHGITGFYYYHNSRFLAFASGKKGLLALPQVPKNQNPLRMAQILTAWPGDGVETAYEGIWRAAAGPYLDDYRPGDRQATLLAGRRDAGTASAPRRGLSGAILRALSGRGKLPLTQSPSCGRHIERRPGFGFGLRSGSPGIGEPGPPFAGLQCHSLNSHRGPDPARRFGDESPYIEATARWAGNIDITYIPAADISPLAGIRRVLNLHDEPGYRRLIFIGLSALLAGPAIRPGGFAYRPSWQCHGVLDRGGGGPLAPVIRRQLATLRRNSKYVRPQGARTSGTCSAIRSWRR